ncbi:serine hydrolase [Flavobacteriales bacterium]|nr:serine hydrolase [Flavobacteriales bacterium]
MGKKKLIFLIVFLVLITSIVISGKSWLFKAIYTTYLQGYTSAYIEDFKYFPKNIIENDKHQKWYTSANYNLAKSPEYINKVHNDLETVAYLIIVNDSIIHEKYWDGFSENSLSNSFSMSKSWISTLIGIAIKDGHIKSTSQKVCDILPQFNRGSNCQITVQDLLTMSSGLDWNESYYNPIGQTAESYYGNNLKKLVFSLKSIEDPGEIFRYNSACTQLLTYIIEETTNKTVSEYASEKLWKPMGAKHPALWNKDREDGDEKGFCCINSNARDFARLGKLYLNFGNWNGLQILDSIYIKNAIKPADLQSINGGPNKNYGYQFWLTEYKNNSIYYARGLWGQYTICIPEKNMIIVRLGRKDGKELENGHFNDLFLYIDASMEIISS